MTYELPEMKILRDAHPRRDGLSETEVCCQFCRSADTRTDVLLIPKALAQKERMQREEIVEEYHASAYEARAIYEYRKHALAEARAPDFFPTLVGRWRPTGKIVQFQDLANDGAISP